MHQVSGRLLVTLLVGVSLLASGAGGAIAQEAAVPPHPSHVHAGTCAELDPNPAVPLADVAPVTADAPAGSVEIGTTTIENTLDELLASPFAINVHASADDIGTYIACGDIAGPVVAGTLAIPMHEQNDSGYSGVAIFAPAASGAGTDVSVYLVPSSMEAAGSATPAAATPAASTDAADAVTISILDFEFDAVTVEVPVGTTVTWTNDGQVIHTATAEDKLWDSGVLESGDSFSYTFDEPGTYEYLCFLHPSMVGTIVVTG